MGELNRREEEVKIFDHRHIINTWDPEQFLRRHNGLNNKLEKINGRDGSTNATIFRVPSHLDHCYASACSPKYISIGPYHQGEPKLRDMEAYKLLYLKELLEDYRLQLKDLVVRMKNIENHARSCYSDPVDMESDDFVEMMLLDGCFIILFMFKLQSGQTRPILSTRYKWVFVLRDLFTLENQLPFFVLESIYQMVDNSDRSKDELIRRLYYLLSFLPFDGVTPVGQTPDHLLQLFHLSLIGQIEDQPNVQLLQDFSNKRLYRKATELELCGAKFKTKDDRRMLHVRFHNGVIEMSYVLLNEGTNVFLRNLVALEQCRERYGMHFTSYVDFIDNLVDSNKNVELLVKRGIFYNWMSNNENVVKHYFNRLGNDIYIDHRYNHLYNTLLEMDKHCKKTWPKWRAMLIREYFNSPWSTTSFVAAGLLLAFTMVQASGTVLIVLEFDKQFSCFFLFA